MPRIIPLLNVRFTPNTNHTRTWPNGIPTVARNVVPHPIYMLFILHNPTCLENDLIHEEGRLSL